MNNSAQSSHQSINSNLENYFSNHGIMELPSKEATWDLY